MAFRHPPGIWRSLSPHTRWPTSPRDRPRGRTLAKGFWKPLPRIDTCAYRSHGSSEPGQMLTLRLRDNTTCFLCHLLQNPSKAGEKNPCFDCRLLTDDKRKQAVPFKQEIVTGNVPKHRSRNLQSRYLWVEKWGRILQRHPTNTARRPDSTLRPQKTRSLEQPYKQDTLLQLHLDKIHKRGTNTQYSSPRGYSHLLKTTRCPKYTFAISFPPSATPRPSLTKQLRYIS